MSSKQVPRPAGILSAPYSRTEHRLLNLMADERNLTDGLFVEHATCLIGYLEGRLLLYRASTRLSFAPGTPDGPPANGRHALVGDLEQEL